MEKKIFTNIAYKLIHSAFICYIPEGITVTWEISADGIHYEPVDNLTDIAGGNTLQISNGLPGTWFRLTCSEDVELDSIF